MNENYPMPAMPEGAREGILKGMYKFKSSERREAPLRAHLLGSGAILNEALKAQAVLEERYGVAADVWSVTSYKELRRDGLDVERWNMLHPGEEPKTSYVAQCLEHEQGVFVAASDYLQLLPDGIGRWFPKPLVALGTDGFGRSESRSALRDFFEVDARFIVIGTLHALLRDKKVKPNVVTQALKDLGIDPDKSNPLYR